MIYVIYLRYIYIYIYIYVWKIDISCHGDMYGNP